MPVYFPFLKIMVVAVALLGSVVLIWANSSLNVERQKIATDYEKNSNLLRESFIIEDVWLYKSADSVNVTLRNIGDLAINATAVNVTAVNSAGANACGPTCTDTETAPYNFPDNINGVIQSKQTLTIKVDNIDWNNSNAVSLDITITTERGSTERIFWSVT